MQDLPSRGNLHFKRNAVECVVVNLIDKIVSPGCHLEISFVSNDKRIQ